MSHRIPTSLRPLALAALLVSPAFAAPGDGNGWCHLTPWISDAPEQFGFYGWEVELGADWAFVLDQGDDTVDVYQRDGGHWSRVQSLASPGQDYEQFGTAS